jgi:malate dehydrogenase (oxaloacetate-decarboxylating)(NADP+)
MYAEILNQCEALQDFSEQERMAIGAWCDELSFKAGERIIEEGSPGNGFYILAAGRVQILKRDQPFTTLDPGAVLGEMSLFNENVRTSEVRALEPSTLLYIASRRFLPLVLRQEPAAVRLMETLGQLMVKRLQAQEAEMVARLAASDPAVAAGLDEFVELRKRLLADWALKYHALGRAGKLAVVPSKPVGTAADLSVAYSPGVAEPCLAIVENRDAAYDYTTRAHLVAVITNGTAVLGLGNIGAVAAKPVMEGKAVLFKRFADLDAFDIEVDECDPQRFVDVVCAIAATFGGINLEDVRAPDCFFIEEECKRRCDIPILHDDQHGTAIIAGAGLLNALELLGKSIDRVRVVFSGAGAAGFACAKYFLQLGVRRENLILTDIRGVVYRGRGDGNYLDELAADTDARTLAHAIEGADVFVGVSAAGVLTPAMLRSMNDSPIVFALANPMPEISYSLAVQTRGDVIVATGRSDYPNQINNVIAFPYLFRGALDTRSRAITDEMKMAATHAVAALAREPITREAGLPGHSSGQELRFGRDYLVPKPFDRRLLPTVASAVARAAIQSGTARCPVDLEEYRQTLERLRHTM